MSTMTGAHQGSSSGGAAPASSVFTIGGQTFTVPQLTPQQLRDIQLSYRGDVDNPIVALAVCVSDSYQALRAAYPDLDADWFCKHIDPPTAYAIEANIAAQVSMTLAEQRCGWPGQGRKDN